MIRIFGHYVSKLFLLLGVLELGLLYLCVLGGYLLRSGLADGEWFLPWTNPFIAPRSCMPY